VPPDDLGLQAVDYEGKLVDRLCQIFHAPADHMRVVFFPVALSFDLLRQTDDGVFSCVEGSKRAGANLRKSFYE
jgi:hypothetical protein